EGEEMEMSRLSCRQPDPHEIPVARLGHESAGLGVRAALALHSGISDFQARGLIHNDDVVTRLLLLAKLDRDPLFAPCGPEVVGPARLPLMQPGAVILKPAAPMALRDVASAGEAEHVARIFAIAQQPRQSFIHGAAAFAVAPARGDDRAGNHPGILVARPADRL